MNFKMPEKVSLKNHKPFVFQHESTHKQNLNMLLNHVPAIWATVAHGLEHHCPHNGQHHSNGILWWLAYA